MLGARWNNFQPPTPTLESHNAQRHRQTDGQTNGRTDRRTDNRLMPIADHTVQQYDRLKITFRRNKPPKFPTSGIAVVGMLHGYSRRRRTIVFFPATAGLLVRPTFCSFLHQLIAVLGHYATVIKPSTRREPSAKYTGPWSKTVVTLD